jgi:hypothetical protein
VSALSYAALAVNRDANHGPSWTSCWVTIGGVNGGLPALNFTSFSMEEEVDIVALFDGNSIDPSTVWLGLYSGTQLVNRMKVGTSGTHFLFLRVRGCAVLHYRPESKAKFTISLFFKFVFTTSIDSEALLGTSK